MWVAEGPGASQGHHVYTEDGNCWNRVEPIEAMTWLRPEDAGNWRLEANTKVPSSTKSLDGDVEGLLDKAFDKEQVSRLHRI